MYKLSGVVKIYKKGRGTVEALRGVDLVIEDGLLTFTPASGRTVTQAATHPPASV